MENSSALDGDDATVVAEPIETTTTASPRASKETPAVEKPSKDSQPLNPEPNGTADSSTVEPSNENASINNEEASKDTLPEQHNDSQIVDSNGIPTITVSETRPLPSPAILKGPYQTIVDSKEASRDLSLQSSAQRALDAIGTSEISQHILLEPLRLACKPASSSELKLVALDILSKLLSFGCFDNKITPEPVATESHNSADAVKINPLPQSSMLDRAVEIVCSCFRGENTDDKVELQIIKALMTTVLNDQVILHGSTMLNATKVVFFIFCGSHSTNSQAVAQTSLIQMVSAVFDRLKPLINRISVNHKPDAVYESNTFKAPSAPSTAGKESLTLESLGRTSLDDDDNNTHAQKDLDEPHSEEELLIRDAIMVFRVFCRLASKSLDDQSFNDLRSQELRSKLLTLNIVYTILDRYADVFASENIKMQKRKHPYESQTLLMSTESFICSCLAKNASNPLPQIFETSAEIFYILLTKLRPHFKFELSLFLAEIYLPVLENKTFTANQKRYTMYIFKRLASKAKFWVEIYLNYDCDSQLPNIYERFVDILCRMSSVSLSLSASTEAHYNDGYSSLKPLGVIPSFPSSLATNFLSSFAYSTDIGIPIDYYMKRESIDFIVVMLRAQYAWARPDIAATPSTGSISARSRSASSLSAAGPPAESAHGSLRSPSGTHMDIPVTLTQGSFNSDDPEQFESLKLQKKTLDNAIKLFNFKPKKGLELLIKEKIIAENDPKLIAEFLISTPGIDKQVLGEYLGEGDNFNIEVMHHFVDSLSFSNMQFVDALRYFLQKFRLPGESQKIDRIMLKFAQRYFEGNPNVFAKAETAYVLAYSVIILNTDMYSPQVKSRMTKEDFIKNNRGIDDNKDLQDEYLASIYDNIAAEEITLKSERESKLLQGETSATHGSSTPQGLSGIFSNRDLQREAYIQVSKELSNKAEAMVKSLSKSQSKGVYYVASHVQHIGPMFEVCWMSYLAGLSGPLQENSNSLIYRECLLGVEAAIDISCYFDISLARISFIGVLAKATNLHDIRSMRPENIDAIKGLLNIAINDGDYLKESWKEVLTCISQLERAQLIGAGGGSTIDIPDVGLTKIANSTNRRDSHETISSSRFIPGRHSRARSSSNFSQANQAFAHTVVAKESSTADIVVAMDKVFQRSQYLSGAAILDFVRALTELCWEEIQSSLNKEEPRLFSLNKMVDVTDYNMTRIRVEWNSIWSIMGEMFNRIGSIPSTAVSIAAVNSLLQLSRRFLVLQELPHFQFQKQFLMPFEEIFKNSNDLQVKELILECLRRMIMERSDNLRSGWATMFGTFGVASVDPSEHVVELAFSIVKETHENHFNEILSQGSFPALIETLTSFAENPKYQKFGLKSVELIKQSVPLMLENASLDSQKVSDNTGQDENSHPISVFQDCWLPVLSGLHSVIRGADDLEVRSRALNYLFDILVEYGGSFNLDAWSVVCESILFPMFDVLKVHQNSDKFNNPDEMSVWLSTTMIQALRNLIALFSHYFETLEPKLDQFLSLLVECIYQENDTLSRIGTSCLEQLVVKNRDKLSDEDWTKITDIITELFKRTTAMQLDPENATGSDRLFEKGYNSENGEKEDMVLEEVTPERRRIHGVIIAKCVLHLLIIETVANLLGDDKTLKAMPLEDIMKLLHCAHESYDFAHRFNSNKPLRMKLWREGFMKQLPNLLKQETNSASLCLNVLFKLFLYHDELGKELGSDNEVENELFNVMEAVVQGFVSLDEETQQRNIAAWSPVVISLLKSVAEFPDDKFKPHVEKFYNLSMIMLERDVSADSRLAVRLVLLRVGKVVFEKS
ncbi:hypothetical protein CANCADRAFT_139370 [Tortispora caseinolytica NRRL Y-17796]|uniref:SEC7 domain-containing protein n=1 Tax=Tortispora caseinolytica NRRL Y-17796 TaxID=767744 RepID=A0A1E4TCD9_9ASCO|nr:hypothetical protein CANCADRAFT_139370 [Tortispora caseinolytica NRRL Y-17796]